MVVEYYRATFHDTGVLSKHILSPAPDQQAPGFYYRWLEGQCRLLVLEILRLIIYQIITNLYTPFYQVKTNYDLL